MKIGEKIRGIRLMKGLSQENMAEMLNISLLAYGDIERGKKDIAYMRLEQIAEKLEVSIHDILSFGERVANFFDQCTNTNISNGKQRDGVVNYDNRELQHQIEKLQLELEKMKAEKERAEMEVKYLNEKLDKYS